MKLLNCKKKIYNYVYIRLIKLLYIDDMKRRKRMVIGLSIL